VGCSLLSVALIRLSLRSGLIFVSVGWGLVKLSPVTDGSLPNIKPTGTRLYHRLAFPILPLYWKVPRNQWLGILESFTMMSIWIRDILWKFLCVVPKSSVT